MVLFCCLFVIPELEHEYFDLDDDLDASWQCAGESWYFLDFKVHAVCDGLLCDGLSNARGGTSFSLSIGGRGGALFCS